MVFKATLNNISVISWRSVLLVEETVVLGANHIEIVRLLKNIHSAIGYKCSIMISTYITLSFVIVRQF